MPLDPNEASHEHAIKTNLGPCEGQRECGLWSPGVATPRLVAAGCLIVALMGIRNYACDSTNYHFGACPKAQLLTLSSTSYLPRTHEYG